MSKTTMPKDGYYVANVQLDTGGLCPHYVRVKDSKLYDDWGSEILNEACSDFREVDTTLMVRVWPQDAAMELEALRNACDGLMRGMAVLRKTLGIEDGRDCLEEVFQMGNEIETLRTANAELLKEVRLLGDLRERAEERVRRLELAGDIMAIHAELGGVPLKFVGVVNAWREAKGQP